MKIGSDVHSDHDNSVDVDNDDDIGFNDTDLDNEHGDLNGRPRKIRRWAKARIYKNKFCLVGLSVDVWVKKK